MAHADMPEAVEHALMRDDAVGERERVTGVGRKLRHETFLVDPFHGTGGKIVRA
jgi:hypothetical protein